MCIKRRTGSAARRRALLLGGVGACVAGLAPVHLAEAPPGMMRSGSPGGSGDARVPPATVSLADYGGKPGAGRAVLVSAFGRAFAALTEAGGGTLLVPAGVYDFGSYADAADIILCRDLRNIAISAYGATFMVTTTARVVPNFFYFFNFHNITLAGASFIDRGFSPWFNWKGMYCVGIQADKSSSGLRIVDCRAERVVGLLASHNNAAGRKHLSDISVHGEVRHAYYGVGANFIREQVHVELVCHNVRRAFIAYSLKNAAIRVVASSTSDWPGSNGLVALVSGGASTGNVENVRVRVEVSGECIHSSYVHFYHQGSEREGHMRDIDATVNVINASSVQDLFVFDHETDGVQAKTARIWDRISLHGSVTGRFTGRVISNRSVSTSPGTVYLDRNLTEMGKMDVLGAGFRVRSP
ncbi:hypothetical protein [Massilia niabensis]|uniref:Pectate lyase superfamily protein domain-containing protein n=1 Tax=Massilia niabensis TaxID=544910 RepID=A0ABW0KZU1_9BURK